MSAITGKSWTCSRCGLRIGYQAGREPEGMPPGMTEIDGVLVCLGCRRAQIEAEATESFAGRGGSRREWIARALARDELERHPERTDGAIAKSLGTVARVVREERQRLDQG